MNPQKTFWLIVLTFFFQNAHGQSQQGHLRNTWSEWHTVYAEQPNLKVEISFNTSTCKNGSLIGYSFYRIRSNFNRPQAWVKFSFEAMGCNGTTHTTPINYKLDKPGITDDLGDHFMEYEVRRINGATYVDYSKSNTNTTAVTTTLNTYKQTFTETYNTYSTQLSKVQNQTSKQQYQAALQNAKTQFDNGYQLAQQYGQQGNQQKEQEQLDYLKKVQQQFDGNLNLLNDVVERRVGTVDGNKPETIYQQSPKSLTPEQSAAATQQAAGLSSRESVAEKTFQTMAPVRQSLGTLLDQALVDKEKLKNDPNAAAAHDYAITALTANTSKDFAANSATSFGFSIFGEIQKEKAFKERMRVLGIAADKERVKNATDKLDYNMEVINYQLTTSPINADTSKMMIIDAIQKSCKPLLVVQCGGTEKELFDAASLSHKLFSFEMSKDIQRVLKKARNDPEDENSFTAAKIYCFGTWRANALAEKKIDKNKELALKTIADYQAAKPNLNNAIKQIRSGLALIIIEEDFNPANIENLTDWELRCQELLKKTVIELNKGNITVALEGKNMFYVPGLLLDIEAKIIHLRCGIYKKGALKRLADFDQLLNDYREFYKICMAGT